MASIRKRSKTYQVSVSNGRDSRGKQIIESATFVPDPGKTEKQNQKTFYDDAGNVLFGRNFTCVPCPGNCEDFGDSRIL